MSEPDTADLLFEIGLEEVPARFMPAFVEQLARDVLAELDQTGLRHGEARSFGTPRRVAVLVAGVQGRQPDREVEVRGPSAGLAYDSAGHPTKAALGFARAQGVAPGELVRRGTASGVEYVFARKVERGQPARGLLPGILGRVVRGLVFPRLMRWGDHDFSFVRPVRWLLCLLGRQAVPVRLEELPGLEVERAASLGHRFLSPGPVPVPCPAEYVLRLRAAGVVADPAERRATITVGARELAAEAGGLPDLRPEQVEELVWLSEHPQPLLGQFAPSYLRLPEPVLTTAMWRHLRYLPVRGSDKRLLAAFIAVRDGDAEQLGTVRQGYERVLAARLEDAAFFFAADRKKRLEHRRPELEGMSYQERLGTMADKTARLEELTASAAAGLGLSREACAAAERAAALAKCDLLTQVGRELPELQGIVGREYALLDGESPAVAEAIGEQYLPSGPGSRAPATDAGLALSLADKADALVGHLAAGVRPTGSEDPYGLRRAAGGIVSALLAAGADRGRHLDLGWLLREAAAVYSRRPTAGALGPADLARAVDEALGMLASRFQAVLEEEGSAYDEVAAVMGATGLLFDPAVRREACRDLGRVRREAWFGEVVAAAVRAGGLGARAAEALAGADLEGVGLPRLECPPHAGGDAPTWLSWPSPGPAPDPVLFRVPEEGALHRAYLAVMREALQHLRAGRFIDYWHGLVPLRPVADCFFDAVLVMDPEAALRANRLALCLRLHELCSAAADLSKLVVSREGNHGRRDGPGGDPVGEWNP